MYLSEKQLNFSMKLHLLKDFLSFDVFLPLPFTTVRQTQL